MAPRGRNVHQRSSSVPVSNRDHAALGLGYASGVDDLDKPFKSMKELRREKSQISYPDLCAMTESALHFSLLDSGALTKFTKDGRFEEADLFAVCWNCSEQMVRKGRTLNDPEYRCDSCKDRPRLLRSCSAYTPLFALHKANSSNVEDKCTLYGRMLWLVGNNIAPGSCIELCRGSRVDAGEDGFFTIIR